MATIANVVIKKADGTTDVTYTAIAGSAGDKLPALWRSETAATLRGNRPMYQLSTQDNGPKTARRINGKITFPIIRMVSAVETVVDKVIFDFSGIVPNALTDAEMNEAVSQSLNLFANAVTKQTATGGYAPN